MNSESNNISQRGRGGPVWLDVPLDVQGAPFPKQKSLDYKNQNLEDNDVDLKKVAQKIMARLNKPNVLYCL